MFLVKAKSYWCVPFLQQAYIICIATEIYATSCNGTTSTNHLPREHTSFCYAAINRCVNNQMRHLVHFHKSMLRCTHAQYV